jgi:hypothetical protein
MPCCPDHLPHQNKEAPRADFFRRTEYSTYRTSNLRTTEDTISFSWICFAVLVLSGFLSYLEEPKHVTMGELGGTKSWMQLCLFCEVLSI